jgi:hypothetical protein
MDSGATAQDRIALAFNVALALHAFVALGADLTSSGLIEPVDLMEVSLIQTDTGIEFSRHLTEWMAPDAPGATESAPRDT